MRGRKRKNENMKKRKNYRHWLMREGKDRWIVREIKLEKKNGRINERKKKEKLKKVLDNYKTIKQRKEE